MSGQRHGEGNTGRGSAPSHEHFGMRNLVSLAVGGTIGSGWLFAAPAVGRAAGVGSLLSWALGGLFMVATAIVLRPDRTDESVGVAEAESGRTRAVDVEMFNR